MPAPLTALARALVRSLSAPWLRPLLGIAVSTAFILLFLRNTDFGGVARAFTEASPLWIIPALAVYFLGIAARAWRWHYLLLHLRPIAWWRLFPIVAVGFGVNNVLPLRAGELVRAHVLAVRHDISRASGLSSIFMTRVYDGLMLTIFLCIGVACSLAGIAGMIWAGPALTAGMGFLVFGMIGAFLLFGAIARNPQRAEELLTRVVSRAPWGAERMQSWLAPVIAGLGAQANPRQVRGALWTSLIAWALEAVMYAMVGKAFGLGLPFPVYLLVAAAANILITAPSTSGGVGPFEWAAKAVLLIYLPQLGDLGPNVGAEEAAIAYAATLHALVLIPISIVGLAALWLFHVPLRRREWTAAS